jgi:hypothetical protein
MSGYIVVFRGTGQPGSNYAGIVTWTQYQSKEAFEVAKANGQIGDEIVAEGVTADCAVELTRTTPMAARLHAAVSKSTYGDGEVDLEAFEMNYQQFKMLSLMEV